MISIIVAFPNLDDANKIKNLLYKNGFDVFGICTSGAMAIQMAENLERALIICGCKFFDMTCLEIKKNLSVNSRILVLASKRVWELYGGDDLMFLEMPVKSYELVNTIEMIMRAKERARKKLKNKQNIRSSADNEIIMKAKIMLMEKNNLSEEEAYRYIQKNSMDSGNNMTDTAAMLLSIMDMT